jgi:hypothetical protein
VLPIHATALRQIWVFIFGYAAVYVHSFCMLCCVERHVDSIFNQWFLTRIKKLPDDDQPMIETCWSDFKCFNVWHLN